MSTTVVTDEEQLVREIREIPAEHWADLLAVIREFRAQVESNGTEEEPLPDPVESFRRGWAEAMTGQTRPLSELWKRIEAE